MKDYLDSQHMEIIPLSTKLIPFCYSILHHCAMHTKSQTIKLGVLLMHLPLQPLNSHSITMCVLTENYNKIYL